MKYCVQYTEKHDIILLYNPNALMSLYYYIVYTQVSLESTVVLLAYSYQEIRTLLSKLSDILIVLKQYLIGC